MPRAWAGGSWLGTGRGRRARPLRSSGGGLGTAALLLLLSLLFGEEEKTIPPLTMCVPKRPTTSSGIEKSSRGYSSNWVKMTQRGGGHGSSRFRQHAHGEDKHIIERGIDRLTSVVVKQSSVVKGSGKKYYGGGGVHFNRSSSASKIKVPRSNSSKKRSPRSDSKMQSTSNSNSYTIGQQRVGAISKYSKRRRACIAYMEAL